MSLEQHRQLTLSIRRDFASFGLDQHRTFKVVDQKVEQFSPKVAKARLVLHFAKNNGQIPSTK